MSLRGVTIKEGKIGSNVAGDNREFGLVCNGIAVIGAGNVSGFSLGALLVLRRPSDAIALGIDENYDTANDVQVYRHISEFYRRAGEGKVLNVMIVGQSKKPIDMIADAKVLVVEAGGSISDIAFAYNPASTYVDTLVDGLNADIKEAIPALQSFAQWCDEHDMPLHTILEGRAISENLSSVADLRDLKNGDATLEATKVTLVVGQDWNYADGLSDMGKKFADIGTYLGVIASAAWNRNPGEVESQNLTDATNGIFIVGGLSNHKKYSEAFDMLETLNDKGYVFPIRYQGVSGYWWNDGHVCAPIVVDKDGSMNQHTVYYSHTIDQSKRALRTRLLVEVKKPVQLEDGKLPASMVGYYNAIGDLEFDKLAGKELISEGKTYTDADSDLLVKKELNMRFGVIPTGCVNEIIGTINLKNQSL
jgi:hypothetical protein